MGVVDIYPLSIYIMLRKINLKRSMIVMYRLKMTTRVIVIIMPAISGVKNNINYLFTVNQQFFFYPLIEYNLFVFFLVDIS